ncbi:lysyl oxidase family protein [Actinoplanes sp. NPDC048791]|uniref:lysyl oxidase family protein n=1 Tax=Actinoplanes sp. NPDC048791 TaxID=3154623 RepID=UPI0033D3401A
MHIRRPLAALTTTALLVVGVGPAVAAAADAQPILTFRSATAHPVAQRFVDGDYIWFDLDLGIHLVAGTQPFDIRAKRKSYAQPIVAKLNGTPLPAGLFTSFGGFEDFTSITIRDAAGAVVHDYTTDWCPNSERSVRSRPDGPSQNAYPLDCGWQGYGDGGSGNPFLLGSVWGIPAGWATPIETVPRGDGAWTGQPEIDLPGGEYQVTVRLNDPYREWLAVPAADATVNLDLTVVDIGVGQASAPAAKPGARTATEAHQHATAGDPAAQVTGYDPRFRPPAKVPATLAAVPATGPKPDLRALPAWDIALQQDTDGKAYINFAATVWNGGTSPLVVDGFRRTGEDVMDAYQYFYDAAGAEVGARLAGTMQWDAREGHLHWHFTDFAQYNLLDSSQDLAVRSGKEAFCLANTDPVDYTMPLAKWRPGNTSLATSCGQNTAVAVREVLDIGNGDTYGQYLPGQSFEVTDLPNGTYWIEVRANPEEHLAELRTDNNAALRKVILGGKPGARTLRVPAVHGLDG